MKREWVFHSATALGSAMIIGGVFALYEREKIRRAEFLAPAGSR